MAGAVVKRDGDSDLVGVAAVGPSSVLSASAARDTSDRGGKGGAEFLGGRDGAT